MRGYLAVSALLLLTRLTFSQDSAVRNFIADSALTNASVSICIKDLSDGSEVISYNQAQSLIPASVMKLITTGVALELLGPGYTFHTSLGYRGSLNTRTGRLNGDIIISGGGDPALGSVYFREHYGNFIENWIRSVKSTGIKRIKGRIITDDSAYDFLPVPSRWQWEDIGNYYGAGVFGLSVYDNTVGLHFRTESDSTPAVLTGISPPEYKFSFTNFLIAAGNTDEGYVYSSPYDDKGWITGSIPAWQTDFVLKASMADPPMFIARLMNDKLNAEGIRSKYGPSTARLEGSGAITLNGIMDEIDSPTLAEIIKVLNHESVNLFAETLLKELGKRFGKSGSTLSGVAVVNEFLRNEGIATGGMFIEDGSGLSPRNAVTSQGLTDFLVYMRSKGKNFGVYYESLPEAGKDGTLKNYFRDEAFRSNMRAKSGSMDRVRCYAGYIETISGKDLAFAILVNNYTGQSADLIHGIEEVLKDVILHK